MIASVCPLSGARRVQEPERQHQGRTGRKQTGRHRHPVTAACGAEGSCATTKEEDHCTDSWAVYWFSNLLGSVLKICFTCRVVNQYRDTPIYSQIHIQSIDLAKCRFEASQRQKQSRFISGASPAVARSKEEEEVTDSQAVGVGVPT